MIRGAIYAVALLLGSYLLVTLLEYFGRFSTGVRTFLFYGFIASALFIIGKFFAIPLFKMFKLGKTISHTQAAEIIGKHFPNVQDKLLNTLQLKERENAHEDNSLLEASINQRIGELRPIPFSSAIDLRENRKYLKWALPPLSVILILLFAAPSILTKSTERLLKHGQEIDDVAPFSIIPNSTDFNIPENSDYTVEVSLDGKEIPDKVYVVQNGQQYLLDKGEDNLHWSYTFKNVQKDTPFRFYASGFYQGDYELKVIPLPRLIDFNVDVNYPDYTGLTDENIRNTGDLLVPQGTKITWHFDTRNTETLSVHFNDSTYTLNGDDTYTFTQTAYSTNGYWIHTANQFIANNDSINYRLQVVPDLHPMIAVTEEKDSTSLKQLYFTGEVKDDYGFRTLTFNYQYTHREDGEVDGSLKTVELPVSRENTSDEFFYNWDLNSLDLLPGDKISYYFEVSDNDGVNGSKYARTGLREYAAPTLDELEQKLEQQNDDIKDKLEESIDDAKKLEKELEELQRQLLEKKEMSWQDKKKLEDLMKKQAELQKQVEQIQQQNEQKNQQQSEFEKPNEKLQEKQRQLEELMNQVMTPELEKLMEEMQRLMDELNKDEIQKELEKMDLTNEDMEKELDRALEQFKQLEWEQKMEKTIDKLEKLAEKQEELSKESENKDADSKELEKKQEELNKEFDELKKELDEAEKLNEELEDPNPMPDTEQQEQEIDQEQEKSKSELGKNKKSSASKSQKSAGEKMKEMAEQMEMAMNAAEEEQQEVDMEALRAILENVITLSFDQEELMSKFKTIDEKDPNYNKLGHTQRKLKDDSKMVEDSLFALSKRVPQISAAVNHEINLVNENMDKAIENIPDRKTPEVTTSQQYVMTSFNNLALMLDEALQQMQAQSKSQCEKPGSGSCNKPGGKGKKPSPSAGDLKKMQDALSKQLEEMKKQGKNQGKTGEGGQQSQKLAQMAAKQAAIRKAVEEKAAELNEDGSGNGNEMKQIAKEMEELQKDIVNNQIDEETLRRQRDIEIRLLKAEEAERIRGQEEKRKSNEAKDYPSSSPEKYEAYLRRKQQETELLKTVPPSLKPYYKEKVNSYFNKLGAR